MKKKTFAAFLTLALSFGFTLAAWCAPNPMAKAPPGSPAPPFTLTDSSGKVQNLSSYRGQPLTLFTFCGCALCHEVGYRWGDIQRGGVLPLVKGRTPHTLVLYHGDITQARLFASEVQLDAKNTVLMADADESVSRKYGSEVCPRVFVINPAGTIHYTNNERGKDSFQIPAPIIVARAVSALRAVTKPVAKPVAKKAANKPVKKIKR
jgi:peroxiredoxin